MSTNVCCESDARDASMLNYKVIFVSDATAARTEAAHQATLETLAHMFADVRTVAQTAALITVSRS